MWSAAKGQTFYSSKNTNQSQYKLASCCCCVCVSVRDAHVTQCLCDGQSHLMESFFSFHTCSGYWTQVVCTHDKHLCTLSRLTGEDVTLTRQRLPASWRLWVQVLDLPQEPQAPRILKDTLLFIYPVYYHWTGEGSPLPSSPSYFVSLGIRLCFISIT